MLINSQTERSQVALKTFQCNGMPATRNSTRSSSSKPSNALIWSIGVSHDVDCFPLASCTKNIKPAGTCALTSWPCMTLHDLISIHYAPLTWCKESFFRETALHPRVFTSFLLAQSGMLMPIQLSAVVGVRSNVLRMTRRFHDRTCKACQRHTVTGTPWNS